MMDRYRLPERAEFGGVSYELNTDFRVILKILEVFEDPSLPEILRWKVALELFYYPSIPKAFQTQAMEYLSSFLRYGQPDTPAPRLISWQQDADAIIAGVNQAAGQEIRALAHVHWWTFLSWFHAISQGQLSTIVAIRDKLRRGKKLEDWDKDFYRENKQRVDIKKPLTPEEKREKQRLLEMLES